MNTIDSVKVEAYKIQQMEMKKGIVKSDKKKEETTILSPEDQLNISLLIEESDKASAHLRRIVEDLLRRQGIELDKLDTLKPEDIQVDQKARDEAQQMIAEGGPLSAEAVSDRIVDFAKAISGGNKEKLDLLRDAIDKGFEAAKDFFESDLPDITNQTYDLIQEKLDAWENESLENVSSDNEEVPE